DSPVGRSLSSSNMQMLSDLERDNCALQEQHNQAGQLLDMLGHVLDGADDTLGNLEKDPELLPNAILRRCTEFADVIGGLANELEQQSPQEQRQLAAAIHEDFHNNNLRLQVEQAAVGVGGGEYPLEPLSSTPTPSIGNKLSLDTVSSPVSLSAPPLEIPSVTNHQGAAELDLAFPEQELNENDILQALAGASTLLRDVEASFRDIGKDDAEEIADVATTLARLFLMTLQNIHNTLTPEYLVESSTAAMNGGSDDRMSPRSTVVIEELADPVEMDDSENDRETDNDAGNPSKPSSASKRRPSSKRRMQRVRVLWPPIGPQVGAAVGWTKEEASKRPLLAAALGLTLWPIAITSAAIVGSASLADGFLQDAYNHFQKTPLVENLEQGAASAFQAGRLTFVTSRLMGRQTLRVVKKQIDRNGGVGQVLENAGHFALDRVTHPVETVGMVWDGLNWGIDRVKATVDQIVSLHQEGSAAQNLQ
ncbi:MAG: hypothetical protein SGILL_002563, partial [Bacillariaceae sp.]